MLTQIVSVAELFNIALQMPPSDTIELPEQSAFEQRPEPLNGVCVYVAIDISVLMLNDIMGQYLRHVEIPLVFIRYQVCIVCVHPTHALRQPCADP